jgi:hypothetical protein
MENISLLEVILRQALPNNFNGGVLNVMIISVCFFFSLLPALT